MRLGRITSYNDAGFEMAKACNLEFIEVCCNSQKDAEDFIADRKNVAARIQKYGLDVSSLGRWNHDVQENGKLNPDKVAVYIALLDAAMEVGAKTFVTGINYDDSVSLFRNYANAVDFFGTLTEHAKGNGIKVAIQNCDWNNFITMPEQWKIVCGENKDLYLKYDPTHAYYKYRDYLAEASDYAHLFAHIHIKGMVRAGARPVDDPPAGMDDLNWGSFMSILYSRGYNGDLSIEPHSAAWTGEREKLGVDFTAKYIRQFMF